MTGIRDLHLRAMEMAEEAQTQKLRRNFADSTVLFQQALEYETQAAVASQKEPSRSILYKSAAALALECNQLREAERLAAIGLAGNPPSDIAYELRDIISRANFDFHLSLRGEVLSLEQFQMSLDGDVVSEGIVLSETYIQRVSDLDKLVYRTGQRQRKIKFDEKASTRRRIANELSTYLTMARAGSYSVTIQIGVPSELANQQSLPNFSDAVEIIDELFFCLKLINDNAEAELRRQIPDPAYYNNFVGVSRRLAPDGNQIKLVGLTRLKDGQEERLAITTRQSEIMMEPIEVVKPEQSVSSIPKVVQGFLRFADSVDGQQIKVKPEGVEKAISFVVPEGYMDDIVRPLWNTSVIATGYRIGKTQKYNLVSIEQA